MVGRKRGPHSDYMTNMRQHCRKTIRPLAGALAVLGLTFTPLIPSLIPADAASTVSKVAVTFDGKTITGIPAGGLKGGINEITITNNAKFAVGFEVYRLTEKHTDAELVKARNSDVPPKWIEGAGGSAGMGAGKSNVAIVNLGTGTYAWGVSSSGPELDGKTPIGQFAVTGDKSKSEPKAGTKITAKEYTFETSGLKAGVNRVAFINAGKEWHHLIFAKIKAGKTLDDVKKELTSDLQGPPQSIDPATQAFLPLINPGVSSVTDITLVSGRYVFVCFMPDAAGKPHVMAGMVKEVKIA